MAIPKFFHQTDSFTNGETISLSEEEARHAAMARRLRSGSEVMLLNGKGFSAIGRIAELNKRAALVNIDKIIEHEMPARSVVLACAIPKGDRQKVMLDMLTQCGVSDFIPLECEFSVTKTTAKMTEKWRRIVVEACKQSGNPFMMKTHDAVSVKELIKSDIWQQSQVFRTEQVVDEEIVGKVEKSAQFRQVTQKESVLAIIGPEGGLSDKEVCLIDDAGANKLSLSQHILRTETAAVAAASLLLNS